MNHSILFMILLSVLLTAAVTDLRAYRIPNWLTFPAMGIGLLGNGWVNGVEGLIVSVQGLGLGISLFVFFYVMGGMGAGDVKLFAAVGSFLGPVGLVNVAVLSGLIGGVYALLSLFAHRGVREGSIQLFLGCRALLSWKRNAGVPQSLGLPRLRYALPIGLGTIGSMFWEFPLPY